MNFYNEHDPKAAAWLRELIREGHIPPGVVDERDIQQLTEDDLAGFTQVHLFAGISGWSYALGLAGWSPITPCWTGSCPCQPFSTAGRQLGESDPRHLWPHMLRLIAVCRPPTVFGEQASSKLGREWLARVRDDLEALGYAVGCADLPAAGVGAPQIRQRLWWVADLERERQPRPWARRDAVHQASNPFGEAGGLLDAVRQGALPYVCSGHPRVSGGMDLMRGFGNAICPQLAFKFITAYLEARQERVA